MIRSLALAGVACLCAHAAAAQDVTIDNTGSTTVPAGWASFGTVFADGVIPAGSGVAANGVPAQIDVRTAWADGSAKVAEVTMQRPTLAAGQELPVTLTAAAASGTPISLADLNPWRVDILLHGGIEARVNVRAQIRHAVAGRTIQWWRQGPLASEGRVDVPLGGSLHLTINVTRFADGTISTDTEFNNDLAMGATGGAVTYSADIFQDGVRVFHQPAVQQFQYEDWSHGVSTATPEPGIIIAHNIPALIATGALPAFDTSVPVQQTTLDAEAAQLGGSTYHTLGSASILQYMPTTGGRADIGPQPLWVTLWLRAQGNPVAQRFALAQADAASGIPWHFRDVTTSDWISVYRYPNLWLDSRADPADGYTALTQPVDPANNGWTTDTAHQPDLSYAAFLLTGKQRYLDDLQAQAAWGVGNVWTYNRAGGGSNSALGYVINTLDQVREQAWNIRQINEAAFASPDGSADATYFRSLMAANWSHFASLIPGLETQEHTPYGYLPGTYGGGTMAPWEQGYFISSVSQAVQMGNADALTGMGFMSHFLAGGFEQAGNGFPPGELISYNLQVGDPNTGAPYQTWAQIEAASAPNGPPNWPQSQGDYAQIAEMGLAMFINAGVDRSDACSALAWLQGSGAPYLSTLDTQWQIRLLTGC